MNNEWMVNLNEDLFFKKNSILLFLLFNKFFFHRFESIEGGICFFSDEDDFGVSALTYDTQHRELVQVTVGVRAVHPFNNMSPLILLHSISHSL